MKTVLFHWNLLLFLLYQEFYLQANEPENSSSQKILHGCTMLVENWE